MNINFFFIDVSARSHHPPKLLISTVSRLKLERPSFIFVFLGGPRPFLRHFFLRWSLITHRSSCLPDVPSNAWWWAMVPWEKRVCSSRTPQTRSRGSMCPRCSTTIPHPWSVMACPCPWDYGIRPGKKTTTDFDPFLTRKPTCSSFVSPWSVPARLRTSRLNGVRRSSIIAPMRPFC